MISSSSRKGSFGIFSNVRHLIVLDIASTLTSVIYGTELKKITVGRLFPNFIRGKEKKQNEYHQNFVYYNEWKHKRYSSRPLLCKRLFHTIHDTFTIIFGYYTFHICFRAVVCWVRRAKISMRLAGLHCLAVLCLIVSYIDKYIIQVICNGIWETLSTCIVLQQRNRWANPIQLTNKRGISC